MMDCDYPGMVRIVPPSSIRETQLESEAPGDSGFGWVHVNPW